MQVEQQVQKPGGTREWSMSQYLPVLPPGGMEEGKRVSEGQQGSTE